MGFEGFDEAGEQAIALEDFGDDFGGEFGGVFCFVEHPLVEFQPTQFAIEEMLGLKCLGRYDVHGSGHAWCAIAPAGKSAARLHMCSARPAAKTTSNHTDPGSKKPERSGDLPGPRSDEAIRP